MADPNNPSQPVAEAQEALGTAQDVGKALIDIAKSLSKDLADLAKIAAAAQIETTEISLFGDLFEGYRGAVRRQEDLDRQTVQTSAILERITGLNAIARKELEENVTGLGKEGLVSIASNNMYKAVEEYSKASIKMLDGTKYDAYLLLGDVDSLFKTFTDALVDDTRMQSFAMQGLTYDLVETMKIANENLNISTATMNDIFQRELSESGKITGDALKDYERSLVATQQLTGVSIDLIGKDLSRMTSDFNHFGMMSRDQLLSLSVNLKQLGLDITDVTRLSDNFSSFDKAAATMSNLAASTGATLDTLELFKLANTDQEAFIRSLRDQLESQGVEFENMNFIQQKQVAQAFGLDPRMLQRLLSDNFEMFDSISEEIGQKKTEISDDSLKASVASMGSLRDELEKLDIKAAAAEFASLKNVSAETAESLELAYRGTVKLASEGMSRLTAGASSMIEKAQESRQKLNEMVVTGVRELTTDPEVKKRYTEMGQQVVIDTTAGLNEAIPHIAAVGEKAGVTLRDRFYWGSRDLTHHQSPSKVGYDMIAGIEASFEYLEKEKIAESGGSKLGKAMVASLRDAKKDMAATFREFQEIIEIESSKDADPKKRLTERFKGVLTDAQITSILSGKTEQVIKGMVQESLTKSVKDAQKAADEAGKDAAGAKVDKKKEEKPAEASALPINIKITLAGGDDLTSLLAKQIISQGLKGIQIDSGQLVHLTVAEPVEGAR
jgi:hypothetical protein